MNILIVSQYFYPDQFRINEIAAALVSKGHKVTVLAGLPNYATGHIPKEYRFFRKRKENYLGVNVVRVPVIARRKGVFWRALNYLSFLITSTFYVTFSKSLEYDAVYCYQTSPIMQAHAALSVSRRKKKPLFLYCLDLWPESLKAWNVGEASPLFRLMQQYSKKVYQHCDLIGVTSLPFQDYLLQQHDVNEQKIFYLPQHALGLKLEKKPPLSVGNKIHLAYGGNIGSVQNIPCLIRSAKHLKDNDIKHVHFDIYGDGSELHHCIQYAQELGVTDQVHFHGRVSIDLLRKHYESADGFLLTLQDIGVIGETMPAKLQEYMSGGKPIFAAIGGAGADIIQKSECGIVVDPSDYKGLADAIADFAHNPSKYSQMGENALYYYNNNFTLDIHMQHLIAALTQLTDKESVDV